MAHSLFQNHILCQNFPNYHKHISYNRLYRKDCIVYGNRRAGTGIINHRHYPKMQVYFLLHHWATSTCRNILHPIQNQLEEGSSAFRKFQS